MKTPLVSVIMSAYNCEAFVEESLRSIFDQTFTDFELIVFNDSSSDITGEIIAETLSDFEGDYTYISRSVGDRIGCGPGRERAISKARGKYIAIQDADDISYPLRLEKQVEFMESHPDIFVVGTWADKVHENGKFREDMIYPPSCHNDIIDQFFNEVNTMIDPSSFFKRDVFNKLGGYGDDWRLVPDCFLWVKAILDGQRFANIQEKLVAHRVHRGSVVSCNHRYVVQQHHILHRSMLMKHKKEVFKVED